MRLEARVNHPEIGICGLSCRLCPNYHMHTKSRCEGCKTTSRMAAGCPFITCAIKRRGIEFCWDCEEQQTCDKWKKHRRLGTQRDSFKCYQTLEEDIAFVQQNGHQEFERLQKVREELLIEMLDGFNEGRSKSYYCIAATVLTIEELTEALATARENAAGCDLRSKAKVLHQALDALAAKQGYQLRLRK